MVKMDLSQVSSKDLFRVRLPIEPPIYGALNLNWTKNTFLIRSEILGSNPRGPTTLDNIKTSDKLLL